jgi:hypothetical protein
MRVTLDSKCLLLGLAAIGSTTGCIETELGSAAQAEAGSVCAFVTGSALGQTITTPSIAVIVPDTQITTDPVRVHIDETGQSILGYSLRTPGVDHEIAGKNLFVSGPTLTVPSFSRTLSGLGLVNSYCVAAGVTTPAVPIHIPASVLQIPGAVVDVPGITVTLLGKQVTVPGRTVFLEGRQIILPGADAVAPPITVETPAYSVVVEFDATQQPPSPLPPAIILAPRL